MRTRSMVLFRSRPIDCVSSWWRDSAGSSGSTHGTTPSRTRGNTEPNSTRWSNPMGYLYRVAQTSVRRERRASRRVGLPSIDEHRLPDVEPRLPSALGALSERQRVAVMLVDAHGWTLDNAAHAMGITVSSLRNHLQRGLARLRSELGVDGG